MKSRRAVFAQTGTGSVIQSWLKTPSVQSNFSDRDSAESWYKNASFSAFHVCVFKHVYFYDRRKNRLNALRFKLNVFRNRDSRVKKCRLKRTHSWQGLDSLFYDLPGVLSKLSLLQLIPQTPDKQRSDSRSIPGGYESYATMSAGS